jgi:hypothetical protein
MSANVPSPAAANAEMPSVGRPVGHTLRRQVVVLGVACVGAGLANLLVMRAERAAESTLAARRARAGDLVTDARAVLSARGLPQRAAEEDLPQADLLQQVGAAMQAAGLPADSLVSTLPEPPRQLPGATHAEIVHRLMFENVRLESLVRFCRDLLGQNEALHIAGLHLRAGADRQTWSADVSVSYWTIVPQR